MQLIWGRFGADVIALNEYVGVDGCVQVSSERTYNLGGGMDGNIVRLYEINSALVARVGTTTHGKQKSVKFIIKVL